MAWLHATPKPDPRTRRGKNADQVTLISRFDQLKRDKIIPQMPPNPAPHLIERLIEIGLTGSDGVNTKPLSWAEINEWQRSTSVTLAPWEARLIRSLSTAYIAEGRKAESEYCPPPWRRQITQRERDADEARLRSVLG